jgi:hypothetical protein
MPPAVSTPFADGDRPFAEQTRDSGCDDRDHPTMISEDARLASGKPGWLLLVAVFVALPLVAVLGGQTLIFHVFGNGSFIATGSPGIGILDWWDHIGRELTVALTAFGLLVGFRLSPWRSVVLACAAGAVTFAWWVAVVLVALSFAGPNALN